MPVCDFWLYALFNSRGLESGYSIGLLKILYCYQTSQRAHNKLALLLFCVKFKRLIVVKVRLCLTLNKILFDLFYCLLKFVLAFSKLCSERTLRY